MRIRLSGIQAFKEAIYEFPDHGFVQITGGNSNGKSILGKVLKAIATMSFTEQAERDALIQDGLEYGFVVIEHRGKVLIVFMHTQRNQCYATLVREGGEEVTRTIREGGIEDLLYEFGFRTYGKNSIVLQIHETFGAAPFVNTSGSINYEIVDSVTTDTVAQRFLANFKGITHKAAKELLEQYNGKMVSLQKALDALVMYDYDAYQKLYDSMGKIYPILKNVKALGLKKLVLPPKVTSISLEPMRLQRIVLCPSVRTVDIGALHLQKIALPKSVPVLGGIKCLTETISNLAKIRKGRCPTCGRLLTECLEGRQ